MDSSRLYPVLISAPGKVILFGEHAVVYGKTAIAASLDLRTYLLILPVAETIQNNVSLTLIDVGVCITWSRPDLEALERMGFRGANDEFSPPEELDKELMSYAFQIAGESLKHMGGPAGPNQITAVAAFLILYASICGNRYKGGLDIGVRSALPVGAGLGSSAAYSVCLAGGLLGAIGRCAGFLNPEAQECDESYLINRWAYMAEKVIHGTPSGIDNTVCVYGGAQKFIKGVIEPLPGFQTCEYLLTNTKVRRSTRNQVLDLQKRIELHPAIYEKLIEAIQLVSDECEALFLDKGLSKEVIQQTMKELFDLNHSLLVAIGVSHPAIERVRQVTTDYGLHSKLTGAGGGGCVITLLCDDTPLDAVSQIQDRMAAEGFESFETTIGGCGLKLVRMQRGASQQFDFYKSPSPPFHKTATTPPLNPNGTPAARDREIVPMSMKNFLNIEIHRLAGLRYFIKQT